MEPNEQLSRRDFVDRTLRFATAGWAASHAVIPKAFADKDSQTHAPWQIGCYTRPWDKYDYRIAFDAIAEAGFEYVGLMTTNNKARLVISVETSLDEAEQVGAEAAKRKLAIPSVYGGGIPVARSLDAGISGLKKLIDNCAACGAKNLLMGGIGDEKLYATYYKAIAECCDYAAEKHVGISVKPHGGLNATGPQCRKTVEMVAHPNFRIWYDPGNIFYYSNGQRNPVDDAATVDGLVVGMCVKDYLHPKNVMVTPGAGAVDFRAVLERLRQGGFNAGPLIVECLESGDLKETLAEAKKAFRFLEELTAQKAQTSPTPSSPEFHTGIAVIDITPPVGYRMSGYFSERLSTGTLNPLHAKALVLRQGGLRAAMVFCDIIGISPQVSALARKQAAMMTGIPAENILIAATHSHTGPLYFGALRKHFHDKALAAAGEDPCEKVDYSAKLSRDLVNVIAIAAAHTSAVTLHSGAAEQTGLSFNRRFHMKNGTVRFNPGVLNPDIVRPAGPVDTDLPILLMRNRHTDKPLAALVNFALHLDTVGGTSYAADYPYYLEQSLRERFGNDFILFFAAGTCGDINHIDVTKRERLKTEYIGRTLARTVAEKAASLASIETQALAVRTEIVRVPLQKYPPEKVAWAQNAIKKVGTREMSFIEQVEAYKILALQMRNADTIDLEVQVFRLAPNVAVVGLPGEVFVELGLLIKEASPFETTLVVQLCHDAPGYIPTLKAFEEGSYETVNSRIEPGGGEIMAEATVRLLQSL